MCISCSACWTNLPRGWAGLAPSRGKFGHLTIFTLQYNYSVTYRITVSKVDLLRNTIHALYSCKVSLNL